MGRKKSYSSELRHIYDSAIAIAQEIKNFQETVSGLIADSEKLHELEPLLSGITKAAAVVSKPPTEPPPGEPPTEPPPGEPPTEPPPGEPPTEPPPAKVRKPRTKKTAEIQTNRE